MQNKTKVAVVTGAGTGLGQTTARLLVKEGWKVYGTLTPDQDKENYTQEKFIPVTVDISDKKSVEEAFKEISEKEGQNGIAALINVAGVAAIASGVIEGVSEEHVRTLFDVNFFGTLWMIQTFLPLLRQYGPGRIVNVASSGVRTPTAFSGLYSVSKYAEEGLSNALRYEMPVFGIQSTTIEPGAMKTPMTADSKNNMAKTWKMMPEHIRELYYDKLNPSLEFMDGMITNANEPEVIAKVILKALNVKKMKIRYVAGADVKFLPFLQRVLGENAFEWMMLKVQKLI